MKILFLEDRPERQKLFLPEKEKDVEILKAIREIYMPEGVECKKIIFDINNADYIISNDTKLIIIHRSALNTRGLQYLNKVCSEKKIKLICFSGGISQQIYNTERFEYLNINSSDFYNKELIPFLKKFVITPDLNLLEVTNENWELSYLFLARQIIDSFQQEEDEDRKMLFQNKLEQLQTILQFDGIMHAEKINMEINKKILVL